MPRPFLHIWMMPWAKLPKGLDFGDVTLWDLHRELYKKVSDHEEIEWLKSFSQHFLNTKGEPTKDIAILQLGDVPFKALDGSQNDRIRWAADAICFSFMAGSIFQYEKNGGFSRGNSERFILKDLVLDHEGVIHFSGAGNLAICHLDSEEVILREPRQNVWKVDVPDRLLLEGLAKVNDDSSAADLRRKLRICFEWFRAAWTNTGHISEQARHIALLTAYESLVRKMNDDSFYDMFKEANRLCEWKSLPLTEQIKVNKTTIPANKPTKFLLDYADIRNSFVHGDDLNIGLIKHVVGEQSFKPRHVMSMVVYGLVLSLLVKRRVWKGLELTLAKRQINDIWTLFDWDSDEAMGTSPHLERPKKR